MMYPWHIRQWQQLQRQRQDQRLSHALLLSGAAGLGKREFADALAGSLLCQQPDGEGRACGQCSACKLMQAGTHPDLLQLEPESADKAIKVDDIRELSRALVLTSQMGGHKVAVIQLADNMNLNAANSLLKTLEEPTEGSILLLVSSRPHRLPITIRSRCQSIVFHSPDRQQALSWLKEQGCAEPENLLALAHGSPLLALQQADESLQEPRKQLLEALLPGRQRPAPTRAAEALAKWPLDHLLGTLYDWIGDLIRWRQGVHNGLVNLDRQAQLEQLAPQVSLPALYAYLDEVVRLRRVQTIPLNAQLLWEDLLISWERIITRA